MFLYRNIQIELAERFIKNQRNCFKYVSTAFYLRQKEKAMNLTARIIYTFFLNSREYPYIGTSHYFANLRFSAPKT